MRVAVACSSFKVMGGRERDCLTIAAGLAKLGHEVAIVTARPPDRPLANALPAIHVLPISGLSNHSRMLSFERAFRRWRQANAVDAVLGFDRMRGLDFYYAADQPRKAHAGWRAMLPRNRAYRRLEEAVFGPRSATHIFFLAGQQARNYRAIYDLPQSRFEILPVTLQGDRTAPSPFYEGRDETRRALGIPQDRPLLINVAAYGHQKGVDRVIEILPALPSVWFLSVGIGENRQFVDLARRSGVADRVRFLPYSEDVAGLMAAADLMVHPARVETTGNVIVESLLYGVPVICSGVCGYADHVEKSGAGALLPEPFRAGQLREAAHECLEPGRLADLRQKARACSAVLSRAPGMDGVVRQIAAALEGRLQRRS